MGSRGVSGYTYSRKVQLAKKIATIDKKLSNIEEAATKYSRSEFMQAYKDTANKSYYTKAEARQYAKKESNYVKGHYMAEKGAGKLQKQKRAYQKELSKLNAGQTRMFR